MPFLMTAYPTFDYFSTKRSLGVNLYITPKAFIIKLFEIDLFFLHKSYYGAGKPRLAA